jgi:alanyl-tRNA synthetase
VSGKHNDLEEVGRDTYHHTFFEMLGNWSFGDYYKKEAIEWGWELLTKVWGLPKNRLWATVYKDDDEAEQLWKKVTDIDPSHVLRFGEKDNFWEMGETGPCGPCSEIHMDRTPKGNASASIVNAGIAEMMEIWNLVFIQYDRDASGKLTPLPAKHVDTGMGFERMCAVLQGKDSNYDTDVFMPVIRRMGEISRKPYSGKLDSDTDIAMRVIADHVRALTFAIADGAIPSNEGRGYVLRRLLRRAARFGRNLGMREPFIHSLVSTLVDTMGSAFPEIKSKSEHIQKVIRGEEDGFNATLDRGLEIFEEVVKRTNTKNSKSIEGEEVFRLYDTFGFPVDLTALLAREKGLEIDETGFVKLMEVQRGRSRESVKGTGAPGILKFREESSDLPSSEFLGYSQLESEARVLRFSDGFVVLDRTPFYAESGGQVGDTGSLLFGNTTLSVIDTQKVGTVIGHKTNDQLGNALSQRVVAKVEKGRRNSIMRNHTATHLVHEALRKVLGEHLHQHGSLVDDKHLRFDFNHFDKVKPEELHAIEEMVNQKISENIAVNALNEQKDWVTIEEAKKRWPNVKMFFGDKYGDRVRVVEIDPGFSVELCGGTHVKSTGDIGYFKFRTEGSVASGIRRIEAVTHDYAYELLKIHDASLIDRIEYALKELDESYRTLDELNKAGDTELAGKKQDLLKLEERLHKLKNAPAFPKIVDRGLALFFKQQSNRSRLVEDAILELLEVKKVLEKELGKYRLKSLSGSIDHLVQSGVAVNGFKVVSSKVPASNADELKSLGDTLRSKLGSGVGLLAAVIDDKVSLVCVVTDDLVAGKKVEAGKIVGAVAKLVGGGGGGRPHMATAGGKDVSKLDEALTKTKSIVESFLHQS